MPNTTLITNYITLAIAKFAEKFNLDIPESYKYLKQYGGLQFLLDNYEIEHTLPMDDTIEAMRTVCSNNEGKI